MFKDATIVFDLDGTLVDTAPDLSNALNDMLTRRGHRPVSLETIRACVGHGARIMIEEACAAPARKTTWTACWQSSWCIMRPISPPRAGPFPARCRLSRPLPRKGRSSRSAPISAKA